jgi:membrane-bound lytic murein transglycosylase D
MQHLLLRFSLVISLLLPLGLLGQVSEAEQIVEQSSVKKMISSLDSALLQFHYKLYYPSRKDTQQLNRYGFAPYEVPRPHASVIDKRLKDICSVIPMDYNPIVQAFIDLYTVRTRITTSRLLGLQHVYFPLFEEVLQRERMPTELKYLAVIESALNPRARSYVGALGLWQFMYSTGSLYGLKADSYVDDRLDPYRSTVAAARHLRDLYNMYGDWHLALAAYNCGPGWVTRAIKLSGKRTFWEIYRYLPVETRGYVPAFIAAAYALNYGSEHNMYPIYVDFNYMLADTVSIRNKIIKLDVVAGATGTSLNLLKDLNPQLKLGVVPYSGRPFTLRAPHNVVDWLYANKYAFLDTTTGSQLYYANPKDYKSCIWNEVEGVSNCTLVYHTVKPYETLETLSGKYRVRYDQILEWNQMWGSPIQVGHTLKIYKPNSTEAPKTESGSTVGENTDEANANGERREFTATTNAAARPNTNPFAHLTPSYNAPASTAGSVTPPPAPTPAPVYRAPAPVYRPAPVPPANANSAYVKVRSGDSLWAIANRNNVTVSQIQRLNGLSNNNIQPGQTLRIR